MTDQIRPPREDLYRAMTGGVTSEDGKTLTVRLAPADEWATIHSQVEGHFLERFARSAYRKTMAEQLPKILFQHGKDPEIGEKVIASTDEVGEDSISPFARGQILDGLPELVRSGLRAGAYGASHRFNVVRETWDDSPKGGPHNPDRLPERTIVEARLFELGPVTWPAYPSASASLRSVTDEMRGVPSLPEPVAPSLDAAVEEPHLEPERRDEPVTIAAPTAKESPTVDTNEYRTLDEMGARVRELDAEIKRAAELPGVLPDVEQIAFDEKVAERAKLDHAMTAWRNRLSQVRERAQDPEKVEPVYEPVASFARKTETDIYDLDAVWNRSRTPDQRDQLLRDNAMRSVEQASFPHPDSRPDEGRAHIAHLLDYKDNAHKELAQRILVTGSPTYRKAFNKSLLGAPLSAEEQRAANAVVGTTTTGGWMVPYVFDPTIVPIGTWTSINPYRRYCTVEQIVGGNVYTAVASQAVTATRTTEAAATTENAPVYEQQSITVKRVQAQVTFSMETEQDRPDFASQIAVLLNEAKDTEEEAAFTLGDGSGSAPFGLGGIHATTNGFWTLLDTTGAAVALADYGLAEAALPLRHRMNAHWFMSRGMIRNTQAFETVYGELFNGQYYGAVGNPVNDTFGNTGLRLLGYPVIETPSVPNTPTTVSTLWAMFGDPKQFIIVDRVGMNIELIPHVFGAAQGILTTGQRAIYAMWRNSAATRGVVSAPTTGGLRLYVKS